MYVNRSTKFDLPGPSKSDSIHTALKHTIHAPSHKTLTRETLYLTRNATHLTSFQSQTVGTTESGQRSNGSCRPMKPPSLPAVAPSISYFVSRFSNCSNGFEINMLYLFSLKVYLHVINRTVSEVIHRKISIFTFGSQSHSVAVCASNKP